MQTDSGATIRVEPNTLKVKVEGRPANVEDGKKLVLEALEKLEAKRKAEEDISVKDVATKRAKSVLSEHPPHMQAILESLRLLEARELEMKRRARMEERPPPADRREDWDMLRGVRTKVSEAAVKPQLRPEAEPRAAGIGRIQPAAPLDAVLREGALREGALEGA